MTVDPTVSFNYNTGNIGGSIVQEVDIGLREDGTKNWSLLADGQILTYTQSYNNADDSVSYYYSLTDKATGVVTGPTFITTLTSANDSAGGLGFFDFSTGNRWGAPNNQDAVVVQYRRYTLADAAVSTIGINSISVTTTDDDRDGVINRDDEFPTDPFESVDTDSDGVGDNSDAHPGYNDSVISAGITQAVWDASQTALTTAQTAQATAEADLTTAQTDLITAQVAQATAEAALAAAPTLADVQQTVMDARAGSTRIDVSGGVASITLTLEETSDLGDWSSPTTTDHNIQLSAPAGSNFYRFKIAD